MRIRTHSTTGKDYALTFRWDLAFYGEALDSRGNEAIELIKKQSKLAVNCQYQSENPRNLTVDGVVRSRRQLGLCFPDNASSIVLETTTLDLVEILELLRTARERNVAAVDLLYAEPVSYLSEPVALDSPWNREFSLSKNRRFEGVPGFVTNFSSSDDRDTRFIAFLGYEGARLAQACEQVDAIAGWPKTVVIGIPGYAPGWEMNSLANNVSILEGLNELQVEYCAAASVTGALEILQRLHAQDGCGRTVVAPLGTKPHSIATALFLISNSSYQMATLIWDHPTKSLNRSGDIRRWHVFRVQFS